MIGDLLAAVLWDLNIPKIRLILNRFLPEEYRLNEPRRNEDHEERRKIGNPITFKSTSSPGKSIPNAALPRVYSYLEDKY